MENHDSAAWDEELSSFVDRELAPPARAEAEAHLAGCGSCRGRLRGLEALKAAVSNAPSPALPGDLKAALLGEARRLEAKKASEAEGGFWALIKSWRPVFVPAGAALALGGALILLQRPPGAEAEETVSVEALLSEHSRYAASRPIAASEELLSEGLEISAPEEGP